MATMTPTSSVESSQALAIAHADAVRAYRDLSPFRIELVLEPDGWHITYRLRNPDMVGGGPRYVIDASNGAILSKRYDQ